MKRILVVLAIAAALLVIMKPRAISISGDAQKNIPAPQPQILATSTINLPNMVRAYALSIGVNPDLAACIVKHESEWVPSKKGDDGNSRGLWQISNVWHPEVPDAVAFSAVSSTIWSLRWIKTGHVGQWSTYWKYCTAISVF